MVLPGPRVSLAHSADAEPSCTIRIAPLVPPAALNAGTGRLVILLRFMAQLMLEVQVTLLLRTGVRVRTASSPPTRIDGPLEISGAKPVPGASVGWSSRSVPPFWYAVISSSARPPT